MGLICTNCKSRGIKIRKNYPHGQNSRAIFSISCRACGSTNVKEENSYPNKRNNRNIRRTR